ncbi:hypothetical protein [Vibrio harveyi]|uniref:hypothetical protein n=1 Tax=Vibrio harveyi TaxID=669 RepID=UPI003CE892C2
MKISTLQKKIQSIYTQQLKYQEMSNTSPVRKEDSLANALKKLIDDHSSDAVGSSQVYLDSMAKLSALSDDIFTSIEKLPRPDTLTHKEYKEKTGDSVQAYQDAVKAYTKNGGKGFYDIGIQAIFSFPSHQEKFLQAINTAIEEGIDIQVLESESKDLSGNYIDRDYRGSINFMIPSSALERLKDILVEVDGSLVDSSLSRYSPNYHTTFVMPYFRDHPECNIATARDYLERTKEKDVSHRMENAFSVLGVFRSECYNSGFPYTEGGLNGINSAMDRAFHHVDIYSNARQKQGRREHVNGLMPNLYVYGSDELDKLGIQQDMVLDISIPREMELVSIELDNSNEMSM